MTDIRTDALREPVDVTDYLFSRLRQLGVKSVHGVPGDYNLVALDYILKNGLAWVGNTNELNAGKSIPAPPHTLRVSGVTGTPRRQSTC